MGSTIFVPELEVRHVLGIGDVTKGMNYRLNPSPAAVLTFCNRLERRIVCTEIAFDGERSPSDIFEMIVTEHVDGQKPERLSTYRHGSLEHLVRVGKGFLCNYGSDRKVSKKAEKAAITEGVDEDLRQASRLL